MKNKNKSTTHEAIQQTGDEVTHRKKGTGGSAEWGFGADERPTYS